LDSSNNISRQVPLPTPVLVVDEEEMTVFTFRDSLTPEGIGVDGFTHPVEAIEYFTNNYQKYRVLVSAIKIQPMNGFEIVRRAKAIKPDVKAILLSPFEINLSEIKKMMPTLPIDKVIQKPVTHEQVIRIAKSYLS